MLDTPGAHFLGTLWNYLLLFLNQSINEQSVSRTAHPPLKTMVHILRLCCQALCPFCVCVSMCLKVQKWTQSDTKVTFHFFVLSIFLWSFFLFSFFFCLFFFWSFFLFVCLSVCLLSIFNDCVYQTPLVSICFTPLNRAWPWRISDLVLVSF